MIIGDGTIRKELEALADSFHLTDEIRFVGSVAQRDTFAYTDLCDILIMPKSNAYGSPVNFRIRTLCKAMHCPKHLPVTESSNMDRMGGWLIPV